MIKSIVGVILGYLAMLATVFITLTASYYLLGMERTFQPGSYDVTLLWVLVMMMFSVVAAFIGGRVCTLISGKTRAMVPLAAFVLVFGLASAVATILASEVQMKRAGTVSNQQAMMNAQLPSWAALLLPVLCAIAVAVGGRQPEK